MKYTDTTSVWYQIRGAKNALLDQREEIACYSPITYQGLPQDATKIVLYHPKNSTPYSKEECKRWVEEVNNFWFYPVRYLGLGSKTYNIDDDNHVFVIYLYRKGKMVYSKKSYLNSILMIMRYLMEYKINQLPRKYFELLDKAKDDVDRFKLLQFVHCFVEGNTNHTLREEGVQTLLSKEEFKQKADAIDASVFSNKRISVTNLWSGRRSNIRLDYNDPLYTFNRLKGNIKTNIYVVGDQTNYIDWIKNARLCDKLEQADVVMFTGGEDVDPRMYNEPRNKRTHSNYARDLEEKEYFDKAKKLNLPCIGICRGSQFLCVMSGGKLVQDQRNPGQEHNIFVRDFKGDRKTLNITSTHHQAAYPFNLNCWDYTIYGWTENMCDHHYDGNDAELKPDKECEIVYYSNTRSLGIQGHPEFKHFLNNKENKPTIDYLNQLFDKLLNAEL